MGSNYGSGNSYRPGAVGTTLTSSGISQSATIPNNAAGSRARLVRLQATGNCYVKFTKGAGTCTVNDIMLATNFPEIVDVQQYDTVSYLQETVAAKINVTPLET